MNLLGLATTSSTTRHLKAARLAAVQGGYTVSTAMALMRDRAERDHVTIENVVDEVLSGLLRFEDHVDV